MNEEEVEDLFKGVMNMFDETLKQTKAMVDSVPEENRGRLNDLLNLSTDLKNPENIKKAIFLAKEEADKYRKQKEEADTDKNIND